jgi:hypothetical protein
VLRLDVDGLTAQVREALDALAAAPHGRRRASTPA